MMEKAMNDVVENW